MYKKYFFIFLLLSGFILNAYPKLQFEPRPSGRYIEQIDSLVKKLMVNGKIPGLSLCIIYDSLSLVKSYGYLDLKKKVLVTNDTRFELASCSKAFTALSILKLSSYGKISPFDKISKYIPWLKFIHKDSVYEVTINQLLDHTSGIPWKSLSLIVPDSSNNALENLLKSINPVNLSNKPGQKFEYSSINYDILGYLIEKVSNKSYSEFLNSEVFEPLKMHNTYVQTYPNDDSVSKGYKIGFSKPFLYNPPLFLGNAPAGYIISNANDMLQWLSVLLRQSNTSLDDQIKEMLNVKDTVTIEKKYVNGWYHSLDKHTIYHPGMNPNFTSYIILDSKQKMGLCVLANSSSNYARVIGDEVFSRLRNEKYQKDYPSVSIYDFEFTICSVVFGGVLLLMFVYFFTFLVDITGKKRQLQFHTKKIFDSLVLLACLLMLGYCIYLLPNVLSGFTWQAAIVWTPLSFKIFIVLTFFSFTFGFLLYNLGSFFPHRNVIYGNTPLVFSASIISGLTNISIIFIITASFSKGLDYKIMVFYIVTAFIIFVITKRVTNIKLIKLSSGYLHELRMKLVKKLLYSPNNFFEKVSKESILTVLNDDVSTIGNIISLSTKLLTNVIIVLAAFFYMAMLSMPATLVTITVILVLSLFYMAISRSAKKLMEVVRKTKDVYVRYISHIINGHKELNINLLKKKEFSEDITDICVIYRDTVIDSKVKFTNASILGQAFILISIALVTVLVPVFLPGTNMMKIVPIIMILLYCVGPISFMLSSVSELIQLRIAWKRIKGLQENLNVSAMEERKMVTHNSVNQLILQDVSFVYDTNQSFKLGPLDLSLNAGEITFIIGGNGSGKSTLAKVLTGCYRLTGGKFKIYNDGILNSELEIGEYFSVIFNPFHLFEKMYTVDLVKNRQKINYFLNQFDLKNLVDVDENKTYSNLKLSSGQRKRLALLQILLEDKPIYLFDEWAADQDPRFKKHFYTEILPELKRMGKIVIVITHDDNYFSLADRIIKLNYGKVELDTYNTEVALNFK